MPTANTTAHDIKEPHAEREALSMLVSSAAGVSVIPLARNRTYVLGRAAEADIVIDDPSISRRHALLSTEGDLFVQDLGSTNGTRVGGTAVGVDRRAQVDVGVAIELGSATLLLQRAVVAAAARSSVGAVTSAPPAGKPEPLPSGVVLRSQPMRRLYEMLDIVAPSGLNVVILGETGVGKEVFAEAIHRSSPRSARALLRLNCAALPESVLEGELFGYEKGAFTGAVQARPGLFESAHGGTVFLDEIGEMPLATQAKLLRVLESGEVLRLGGRQPTVVDVRFVAATHRDLRFLIASGAFRADLYFRLNGISVVVPPLRDRREDVPELVERFVARAAAKTGRRAPRLRPDGLALLDGYSWPGNVRELRNIAERAVAFCRNDDLTAIDLLRAAPELSEHTARVEATNPDTTTRIQVFERSARAEASGEILNGSDPRESGDLRSQRVSFEKERIVAALAKTSGNQKKAAELLGVSRRTLVSKLALHDIGRPRKG